MTTAWLEDHEWRLVLVGTIAGGVAVTTYLAGVLFSLPEGLSVAFFVGRGPLTVVAFVGFHPFLAKPRPSAVAPLATVFGVLSGATTMMFAAVQMTNLHYIGRYMRSAEAPAEQAAWEQIFQGVFTVQNGINYVADFFLDWTAFLYALVMWKHPHFGKVIAVASVVLVGPHFVMKLVTYPEPSAEAGLFDGGPLVGVWFLLVLAQVARKLGARREPTA